MKSINLNFSNSRILALLSINWIANIVLTCYFLGETNTSSMAIVAIMFTSFILQLGFLTDQFKRKKNA